MRFYIYLFFCFVFCLTACVEHDEVPKDVIPKQDMPSLLYDIQMVDGSLSTVNPVPDSLSTHGLALYLAVFKEHHVDSALFRKSMKYYTKRPDLLYDIFAKVKDRLKLKIDSIRKIDSLKTVAIVKRNLAAQKKANQITKPTTVVTKNAVPLK